MMYELIIAHDNKLYSPSVVDSVTWETERKGVPGKLSFKMIADDKIHFSEGDAVRFKAEKTNIFYGFIFTLKRDKEGIISVTCYDQLRYLKNKDTLVYENKTASDLIKMIAGDFNLNCGTIANTSFKIESRIEDNQTLFDMIQNALDMTLQNKNELYVFYDDFGKLTLSNLASMRVNILIDSQSGENYDYTTSIDSQTYNKIKLTYDNEEEGKREIYIAQDGSHINQWGVLQYYESVSDKLNAKNKADSLLKLYNQVTKNLTIKGVFGHVKVRAGSLVGVKLDLGDIKVNSFLLVEKCSHKFMESEHTMDLTLRGGTFIA